jgi:hypothetical protein
MSAALLTANVLASLFSSRPRPFLACISVLFKAAATHRDDHPFLMSAGLLFAPQALPHHQFHLQFLSNIHPKIDFSA